MPEDDPTVASPVLLDENERVAPEIGEPSRSNTPAVIALESPPTVTVRLEGDGITLAAAC